MALQSYTLEQLSRLELLAFRKDWQDAFSYNQYELEDCAIYAKYLTQYGIIKFIKEYQIISDELARFDNVVTYLINIFDIR